MFEGDYGRIQYLPYSPAISKRILKTTCWVQLYFCPSALSLQVGSNGLCPKNSKGHYYHLCCWLWACMNYACLRVASLLPWEHSVNKTCLQTRPQRKRHEPSDSHQRRRVSNPKSFDKILGSFSRTTFHGTLTLGRTMVGGFNQCAARFIRRTQAAFAPVVN